MKFIAAFCLLLTLLPMSAAFAKRGAPKDVAPVKANEVEYRAPHAHMGCVEAWDTSRGQMIWRRQIYVVKYQTELERDVQDTFISRMELSGRSLMLTNERGSQYQVDLDSLEVKVLKGSMVEGRK